MQTHLRWETSTRHRSLESHLLVTSSPTRCKLPLPIVQATQAAKSLNLGDSHISECPLWLISGQTVLGQNPTLSVIVQKRTNAGAVNCPLSLGTEFGVAN